MSGILSCGEKRKVKRIEGGARYWRWQARRFHKAGRRQPKVTLLPFLGIGLMDEPVG